MRVVLDTNVLISAFLFPGGAPEAVYRLGLEGRSELMTSLPLLAELGRVLSTKFGWDDGMAEEAVAQVARIALVVEPSERVSAVKADPADDRVLEAAAERRVEASSCRATAPVAPRDVARDHRSRSWDLPPNVPVRSGDGVHDPWHICGVLGSLQVQRLPYGCQTPPFLFACTTAGPGSCGNLGHLCLPITSRYTRLMAVEGTRVIMKSVEVENKTQRILAGLGGTISVSYACAKCEELLPRKDHGDGLIEITAQCPKCQAVNRAHLLPPKGWQQ